MGVIWKIGMIFCYKSGENDKRTKIVKHTKMAKFSENAKLAKSFNFAKTPKTTEFAKIPEISRNAEIAENAKIANIAEIAALAKGCRDSRDFTECRRCSVWNSNTSQSDQERGLLCKIG